MQWFSVAGLLVLVFAVSFAASGGLAGYLRRRAILDHPNERSSHAVPTPHGGGLAVIAVLTAAWVGTGLGAPGGPAEILVVCAAAAGLAVLSWLDDLRDLPVLGRLIGQGAAVAVALAVMPERAPYMGGLLPPALDLLFAGLLWVWFINLFNFMDGIDGIAATETACIGVGIAVVAVIAGLDHRSLLYGLTAAAAVLGFLYWNWHPARLFLGDVGSVPLGFLLGWLLLSLAARGQWPAALILPLYYLADATLTLIRRALRGERVWQAHREHYYQRAVQAGRSHAAVVAVILAVNVGLVMLAGFAARGWVWPTLLGAIVIVALLLAHLGSRRPSGDGDPSPPAPRP
jgi:UDP-N-acetylmuramyl pentapeptide phosphotransferase/UDP-N-acetylglucosamine-1-phosphate transferase